MHEELIQQIIEDGLGTARAGVLARKLYNSDEEGESLRYALIGWMYLAEKELVKLESSEYKAKRGLDSLPVA
jgi:hypothetical protein